MDNGGPQVLIAEDNPALLRVTQFTVERLGLSVVTAANGADALAKLQDGDFDLLITDQQMPRMTGIELIRAARGIDRYAQTPVILLTAKALELSHEELAESLGVDSVLGKPFSPVQVAKLVQELVAVAV